MVKDIDREKGSSVQTGTDTHTHTNDGFKPQAKAEKTPNIIGDRICPLSRYRLSALTNCYGSQCAWFDFKEDACAVLSIARMLSRQDEWERDRS